MVDINGIMEVIPHRFPFLLVDKILEYKAGEYGVGVKNVTINEPFFQGHFPQKPVMPGVLLIEALAQVGAFVVLSLEEHKGKIAYFGAIDNVKFRKIVEPSDVLTLRVDVTSLKRSAGKAKAVATVDSKVCASCELTFMFHK